MAQIRDPAAARHRILQAAAEECARHGFAGARVDRVAAAAGLNKRMLYHYFGDKGGLVQAVLARQLERVDRGDGLDQQGVRLLLWALLDPATAAATAARVQRIGRQGDASRLLVGLLSALGAGPSVHPSAGRRSAKVRIRLKSPPARNNG